MAAYFNKSTSFIKLGSFFEHVLWHLSSNIEVPPSSVLWDSPISICLNYLLYLNSLRGQQPTSYQLLYQIFGSTFTYFLRPMICVHTAVD